MDKSGKIYVKAMNKYNDGYIDKALALCEKSISLNITNAAALNLKGILCYLKGDLESAKKMWNINYKRNNDKVSQKYLNDTIKDKERLQVYVDALEKIKQFYISGALESLKQCENSHFNFINVNNLINICYIKQGEYDKALLNINEVLKVDKKNTDAILNKKTLIEYGNLKREINYKKIFVVIGSSFLNITFIFLGKIIMHNIKNLSIASIKIENNKSEEIKKNTEVNKQSTRVSKKKPIEKKA